MDSPGDSPSATVGRDSRAASHGAATHEPLVRTKLVAPASVTGHGERRRLSASLDRGLEDATRLTLLSAPPGYGKTVALVGWLESRRIARAWLTLDAADDDLARFARYLVAALRTVRPGAGDVTDGLFGPGANPGPDLVGASLLEELAASDDPFVLVLDDYHLISAEPIHRLVRFLIERGPPFAHLILLTREDPPLPLARLRAHGRLVELRADDLRCTGEETSTYLAGSGISLGPELVERLLVRTEGWIAGLQLAAISLRNQADPAAMVEAFRGGQRFVLDYLADEVLGAVDQDLRRFLVQTSIAERFTASLCRELTGREDADALLARAERANLFLVPLDAERHWYRYHRLFADYLGAQLEEHERRELHERAADHFERAGLVQEAIDHALAAGSVERAIRLVEGAARPTFDAGELATLLGWLDALPAARVAKSPELVSLNAWALFDTGQVAAAMTLAERHLVTSAERGPAEGRLFVLRALLATVTGPDAESLAMEGLELIGDDELFRSRAYQASGLAKLARGEYGPAVQTLREGFAAAVRARHPMAVLPAVNPLGHALDRAPRRGRGDLSERACGPRGPAWQTAADRLVGARRARDRALRSQRPGRGPSRAGGGL